MGNIDGIIFIDANQYLDLYRTHTGKKLLASLNEQKDYIFVTEQIVDEVQRNKVYVAATFLKGLSEKLKLPNFAVPDHLFGKTDDRVGRIRDALKNGHGQIDIVNEQLMDLAHDLLDQITSSEDEASKVLKGLFAKAVPHTEDELNRAKVRKELGSAPGKKADPLGDQLTWEQILSRCQSKTKLWIITGDGDYATEYKEKMFLNAALYQELVKLHGSAPEVFCFNNIPDRIKHFSETTKVKAEKLPTPEETEQIKKELESLPPLGWLSNYDDGVFIAIQNDLIRKKYSAALLNTQPNQPFVDELPPSSG